MSRFSIMQVDDSTMVLGLDDLPVAVIVHAPMTGADVVRDHPTPKVRFHGVEVREKGDFTSPRLVASRVSGSSEYVLEVDPEAPTYDLIRVVAKSLVEAPPQDEAPRVEHPDHVWVTGHWRRVADA